MIAPFWPYSDTAGYNFEDFAFESVQRAFARESFKYNEGYHQLAGPMLRYGVDVALGASTTSKPNTVYYSDKHVSQSIEDAYRNIHTNPVCRCWSWFWPDKEDRRNVRDNCLQCIPMGYTNCILSISSNSRGCFYCNPWR